MDLVNTSDACISEEETKVFVDAAAVARRKRMEIRRFKERSNSFRKVHSHGFQKRSRPLSAGICDLCDFEQDNYSFSNDSNVLDAPLATEFLAETGGEECAFGHSIMYPGNSLLRSSGLVRSKSFPPEGWHRSSLNQCVVKFSKTTTGVEGRVVTVLDDERRSSPNDFQPGLCATWTMDVSSGPPPCVQTTSLVEGDGSSQQQLEKQRDERNIGIRQSVESSPLTSGRLAEPRLEVSSFSGTTPKDREDESSTSGSNPGTLDQGPKAPSTNLMCTVVSRSTSRNSRCFSDGKCPPSGKLLLCGRRREMEDIAALVPSFASLPCAAVGGCLCDRQPEKLLCSDLHFFAVYDGHGGSQASKFCAERLHQLLGEELSHGNFYSDLADGWVSKWGSMMTSCFMKMDVEVGGVCPTGECNDADGTSTCCVDAIAPENVGTTAVVAVVGSCQIIVGNCGDSRAVLSRGGKAIPLSKDHKVCNSRASFLKVENAGLFFSRCSSRDLLVIHSSQGDRMLLAVNVCLPDFWIGQPEREDENSRIESAGGRVIYWDGYRVGGLLALSRALGDRYLKRYVISEPEVTCLQRTEKDECLILASDGLWDVISNEVACEVARKSLASARRKYEHGSSSPGEDSAASQVAALLVKLAYGKGSKDNISVVVVDLKGQGR